MMRRAFAAAFVLLLPGLASADGGVPGTLSLTTGSGARWLAMGRAGAGDPDSDLNPVVNPALAAGLGTFSAGLLYSQLFDQSNAQSLVIGYPIDRRTVAQLTFHRAGSDGIPAYDGAGTKVGEASFARYEGTLTGAYRLRPDLSAGITLRGVSLSAEGQRVGDGAGDLGVSYLYDDQVGLGAKVENAIGSKGLGRHFRGGVTARAASGRFSGSIDFVAASSTAGMGAAKRWYAGIEAWPIEQVALRAGAETAGYSAGLGISFGTLSLDYAAVKTELGLSHWVSLQLRSKKAPSHATKKKPAPKPAPAKPAPTATPKPLESRVKLAATALPTRLPVPAIVEQRVATPVPVAPTATPPPPALILPTAAPTTPPLPPAGGTPSTVEGPASFGSLSAPAGIVASKDSSGTMSVSWNPVAGAAGYNIYVSAFPWENGNRANPSPIRENRVTLPSIGQSGPLYVRVEALDSAGKGSPLSEPATAGN